MTDLSGVWLGFIPLVWESDRTSIENETRGLVLRRWPHVQVKVLKLDSAFKLSTRRRLEREVWHSNIGSYCWL